jgi:hypothetical protein
LRNVMLIISGCRLEINRPSDSGLNGVGNVFGRTDADQMAECRNPSINHSRIRHLNA